MDSTDLSNLSEVESLSDSDWLEVASSRASEDNDSVAEFDDSDREDAGGRPSSRRSFSSIGSLRDEVKGWEGLAEDSSDESPRDCLITANSLPLSLRQTALGSALESPLSGNDDPEEEQRVKDALDQSMMSTLSSSRSNSLNASVQTSIVHSRDLRLSFPDPITSSRDNMLSTSYEEVSSPVSPSPPETVEAARGVARVPSGSAADATTGDKPTAADPGSSTTPEVPQVDVPRGLAPVIHPDFYVVMYGASSAMKWSFVDALLDKIARGIGLHASPKVIEQANTYTRFFLSSGNGKEDEVARAVSVVDCTDMLEGDESTVSFHWGRPSLAIVFLPTDSITLPEHTLYLPVLAQSLAVLDLPSDQLLDAEQQWELIGIPQSKLARLSRYSSSVIDQDELERARPLQVSRALRPLFADSVSKQSRGLISKHTLTIFAMVSMMIGYMVQGSLGPSSPPSLAMTTAPPLWGLLRPINPVLNQSLPTSSVLSYTPTTPPSSVKDLATAALTPAQPTQTSISVLTQDNSQASTSTVPDHKKEVSKAPSHCECGCGLITWPETPKTNTDLMLRPVPSVPSLTSQELGKVGLTLAPTHSESKDKGKGKAIERVDASLYSLSVRIAGSLSEYFDFRSVAMAANKDLQELLDALDELVNAIGRQTKVLLERSRSPARLVRDQVYQRHARAVEKARELKDIGGRMITLFGDKMKDGIVIAKENAKTLKQSAIDDGWTTSRERVRRMARRARRTARRDARKVRRSITF
ncbi:hypothetical protein CERSUDRAFT_117582 [Gelatoporia subvermispora B]|uniref:Uncharacterized protein n=1 Tax=Ceriporiopsis subvermispora (strain B) TaxID=914234 RepID=M2QPH2_CERS8|nr:hypothetical protein CERSUDRAFT_117582 [Gelatoporia subvermispora B]